MKKIILVMCVVALLVCPVTAAGYSGGAGTEASPYQIETETDLNTLAASPDDWASHFVVMNDITFTAASTQTIGTTTTKFTGTFNGNRKTISNFTIDKSDSGYIGLFGYVGEGGEIKDIVVEAGVAGVKGDSKVGILVGGNKGVITSCSATGDVTAENENAGGLVGQNYKTGIITDCSATGDTTTIYNAGGLIGDNSGKVTNCNAIGNANANSYTGGIAGSNGGGTITKCTAKGDVYSYEYGGGLVGSNNGNITDCSATGDVHGHSSQGGLVGFSESGNIINCSASGDVNGDYCDGGLVGINSYDNSITNCFATGNVTVEGYGGGGLIGQSYGTIANCYATGNTSITGSCAGGLVGDSVGTITNCYATGNVHAGGSFAGGLVGDNSGTITNCYRVQSAGTDAGTIITEISKFKDYDWLTGNTPNDGLNWSADIISTEADDTKIWFVKSDKSVYPIFQTQDIPLYSGGTGTLVDPYVITSCADIVYLSTDSKNWNKSFIQTEDITFSGDSPTTQIGNYEFEFVGVYDGQEHSVSNYELVEGIIDGGRVAAFFGVIGQGGDIRNLNLVDVNITGGWNTGGFVGLNDGMITNSNISGKITGSGMSGGFVGDNAVNGVITNCHADVIVISTKQSGGFVGIQEGNIANCSSSGDVSGSEGYAGGFMGYCNDGQVTQNCHATGDVTDDSYYPGGFCSAGAGAFINCYATGDVIGSSSPGGFMGASWDNGKCTDCYAIGDAISSGNYAGGFGGQLISGEFKNCYATGDATAKFGAGGFAGESGGTFTNCYAKGTATTTNNHFAGGFSGLTAGTFVNCYATGDASSANMFAGGFAGGPGDISAMTNCFATGSATVTNEHVGGFIGLTEDTTITNCYRVQSTGTSDGTLITDLSKFKDIDWLTGTTTNDGLAWPVDIISNVKDDTKIWGVDPSKAFYPVFQHQYTPATPTPTPTPTITPNPTPTQKPPVVHNRDRRAMATPSTYEIDESGYNMLLSSLELDQEFNSTTKEGELHPRGVFDASMFPFTGGAFGEYAAFLIFAIPFVLAWMRQNSAIIPMSFGCVLGTWMLWKLPAEWQLPATGMIVLSMMVILYGVYKEKY